MHYKKTYLPDGVTVFCNGVYLRIKDGKLEFDVMTDDADLFYRGNIVYWDADEQRYYYTEPLTL